MNESTPLIERRRNSTIGRGDDDYFEDIADITLLSYDIRDLKDESDSNLSFIISTIASLIIAGFGSIFSGWLINWAQDKEFLSTIPDALMLVTPLLGLKGNLEMTFASRLGTLSNTGEIDDSKKVKKVIRHYIPFLQVQSIFFALLLSVICVGMNVALGAKLSLGDSLIIITSVVATASVSSFIVELFLIGIVFTFSSFGIDSDNFATPIAASCGDFGTFLLLLGFGTLQLKADNNAYMWPTLMILIFFTFYIWPCCVYYNSKSKLWNQGWWAIITAMIMSGVGGWILKFAVESLKWTSFSTFQPLITGLAGNRVSVQSSRVTTSLYVSRAPFKTLPYGTLCQKLNPVKTFFGSARLLVITTIPAQFIFLLIIIAISDEVAFNRSLIWFVLIYLSAGLVQIIMLIYFCQCVVHLLWRIGCDPDSSAIPLLTSFGDFIGSLLLLLVYYVAKPTDL